MENAIKKIWTLAKEIAAFTRENRITQGWLYLDKNNLIYMYNDDNYKAQSVKFDEYAFEIKCTLYTNTIAFSPTITAEIINETFYKAKNAFDEYVSEFKQRSKEEMEAEKAARIAILENELLTLKNG